jgi:hypothetical protein
LNEVLDPRITLSRSTNATYFDATGLLQTAGANVARFDHNPTSPFESLGWLIEEQRTNNCLQSRDLSNASWVKANVSGVKDAVGIDGVVNSASTLTANAANGTCLQTITLGSADYNYSVFVKRKTGVGVIDLTDNNLTNVTDISGSINSSTWTRFEINRTQANPVVGFRIVTSGDEIEVDFNQLEAGPMPSSPIETTTGSVTRNADVGTISDVSWLNQGEGTFFVQVHADFWRSDNGGFFAVDDGTNDNLWQIALFSSEIECRIRAAAAFEYDSSSAQNPNDGDVVKVALAAATDDGIHAIGGSTFEPDALVTLPTGLTNLKFGNFVGFFFTGHLQALKYWPIRKLNSFLQGITV